ncbi:MAG: glycosyltransferase family 4 protein [Acidobacteria bacterium]|nr:glycosyltransferase family 4 protein [Acidobacteriota bacterium]
MNRRYLAAVGDANNPRTWSGVPYHFLQAALREKFIDEGLPLSVEGPFWKARRWIWNGRQAVAGKGIGGYQFSQEFLECLWKPHKKNLGSSLIINCFQLYPLSLVHDESIEKWFFIDQTLLQLFDSYGVGSRIGRTIAKEAFVREKLGYQRARGVVVHSAWAAKSLLEDYAMPEEQVHIVTPGANLDLDAYLTWEKKRESEVLRNFSDGALRLIFVGKEWKRKGLDRLLEALSLARRQGARVSLRVIGCPRDELPAALRQTEGVEWLGFIRKELEPERFLDQVGDSDVGCLLSRAEAGGIVVREFHALGLAVLASRAGGLPEHTCAEASYLVEENASPAQIAEVILSLDRDRTWVRSAKTEAWKRRRSFLYPETIRLMRNIFEAKSYRAVGSNAN